DERVGQARIYAKLDTLRFDTCMVAVKTDRTYVIDGYSHLIDLNVNGIESGISNSKLRTGLNSKLNVSVRAAAYLDPEQNETGAVIAARDLYKPPYWHIERARIGKTRNVQVELIVNGEAVEKKEMPADGNWKNVSFEYV